MTKMKIYCGIDISGDTIDICFQIDYNTFDSKTLSNDHV
jgi:hypothetical protein